MNHYKEYKTTDELVKYLKDEKKFIIDEEDICFLEEISYTSLVNPYKRFFATGCDNNGNLVYKESHNFKELLKIVEINDKYCKLLYEKIGAFEKKFKILLFNEICEKYIDYTNGGDRSCLTYSDEIKLFFDSNYEIIPSFCPNYLCCYVKVNKSSIKKVIDSHDIDRKKAVLERIYQIGIGKNIDGSSLNKSDVCKNKLILHYLGTQKKVPLWIIPHALTLGELQTIFKMIDTESQKRIIARIKTIDLKKVVNKDIISFTGHVESIRKMRNIISHYESILPFFMNEMNTKKLENSSLYSTLILLDRAMKSIDLESIEYSISTNSINSRPVRILNMMLKKVKQ